MNFLRFLTLLALAVWLGGLIFFPAVAQTAFSALPSTYLAGQMVRDSLRELHWMGFISGVVFLASSLLYNRVMLGRILAFGLSHVLVAAMLSLTAVSQFRIMPRMDSLRASAGEIACLSVDNPIRQQFDSLHAWSTRVEGAILLLGLVVLYLTSRGFSSARP